jgi:hypothetical protein
MEAALRRVTQARSGDDARVRQRISAAGLPRPITLAGEWPPQSVGRAYRAADAFVLPSLHEGYGRWRSVDRLAELPRWAVERRLCRSCPWRRLALVPASIGPGGLGSPTGCSSNSLPRYGDRAPEEHSHLYPRERFVEAARKAAGGHDRRDVPVDDIRIGGPG